MKCEDVRRAFPHLVAGEIPLTEWAILETHMAKCPACRQELERQEVEAVQRERLRRRSATAAALVATAEAGATGGGAAGVTVTGGGNGRGGIRRKVGRDGESGWLAS